MSAQPIPPPFPASIKLSCGRVYKAYLPLTNSGGEHIKVDANMKTNIAGLFACGDCVARPSSYLKSAGQGLTAALNAVDYLAKKDK